MATHAVGKGIIALIQTYEPGAIADDTAARLRVLNDLGDSVGGLLAFAYAKDGPEGAHTAALAVLNRMRAAAPNILRMAEAELARKNR